MFSVAFRFDLLASPPLQFRCISVVPESHAVIELVTDCRRDFKSSFIASSVVIVVFEGLARIFYCVSPLWCPTSKTWTVHGETTV